MTKKKTTRKAIMAAYPHVIGAGCGLQNLLRYEQPRAYTAGVYGWNADIYVIDGIAIATGYRSFGDRVSYELIARYESAAKDIHARGLSHEETREQLHALAVDFVRAALEEGDI